MLVSDTKNSKNSDFYNLYLIFKFLVKMLLLFEVYTFICFPYLNTDNVICLQILFKSVFALKNVISL